MSSFSAIPTCHVRTLIRMIRMLALSFALAFGLAFAFSFVGSLVLAFAHVFSFASAFSLSFSFHVLLNFGSQCLAKLLNGGDLHWSGATRTCGRARRMSHLPNDSTGSEVAGDGLSDILVWSRLVVVEYEML